MLDEARGLRRREEAVLAVVDPFEETAERGRDRGYAERAHLAQRVAEGLGHRRRQQREVGPDPRHVGGQLAAFVVELDVDAALAEVGLAGLAAAQEIHVGELDQPRQHPVEQVAALGAVDPAGHQQHRARPAGRRRVDDRCVEGREPMGDDAPGQCGEARLDADQVSACGEARRDQRGAGRKHQLDPARAKRRPEGRIALVEGQVGGGGERRGQSLGRETGRIGAEVGVQDRPARIVVVGHDQRRQPRRQRVERVADERRDHDRVDREVADHGGERGAPGGMRDRGRGDRPVEHEAPQRRRARHRGQHQLEHLPVATPPGMAARDQRQVAMGLVGRREIVDEAVDAAAPAVDHVQHDRSAVEAGQGRDRGRDRREAAAQDLERRCRRCVARIGGQGGAMQRRARRADVERVHDETTDRLGQRVRRAPPDAREPGQCRRAPQRAPARPVRGGHGAPRSIEGRAAVDGRGVGDGQPGADRDRRQRGLRRQRRDEVRVGATGGGQQPCEPAGRQRRVGAQHDRRRRGIRPVQRAQRFPRFGTGGLDPEAVRQVPERLARRAGIGAVEQQDRQGLGRGRHGRGSAKGRRLSSTPPRAATRRAAA